MLSPFFRLFLAAVYLATFAQGWHPGQDAPGLARDTAPPSQEAVFHFDMNTGIDVQEKTATEDANEVEYTLDNGSPYPHPYEYQRIGDNGELSSWPHHTDTPDHGLHCVAGPLLLQDTHLLELFGAFDRERIPERVVHARGGQFPPF